MTAARHLRQGFLRDHRDRSQDGDDPMPTLSLRGVWSDPRLGLWAQQYMTWLGDERQVKWTSRSNYMNGTRPTRRTTRHIRIARPNARARLVGIISVLHFAIASDDFTLTVENGHSVLDQCMNLRRQVRVGARPPSAAHRQPSAALGGPRRPLGNPRRPSAALGRPPRTPPPSRAINRRPWRSCIDGSIPNVRERARGHPASTCVGWAWERSPTPTPPPTSSRRVGLGELSVDEARRAGRAGEDQDAEVPLRGAPGRAGDLHAHVREPPALLPSPALVSVAEHGRSSSFTRSGIRRRFARRGKKKSPPGVESKLRRSGVPLVATFFRRLETTSIRRPSSELCECSPDPTSVE